MKKIFLPIIVSIILGFFMGFYIFHEYDSKVQIKAVFNEEKVNVYFLQLGVYSDLDKAKESAKGFESYIYTKEDGQYHVYVGMTKSKENSEKLKGFFKEKGYIIYVKKMIISDSTFIDMLEQYDEFLKKTEEEEAILKILEKILNQYKEVVLDGSKN